MAHRGGGGVMANFEKVYILNFQRVANFFSSYFLGLKSTLGGGDGGDGDNGGSGKTNAISLFFDASGNKNIGATIPIGREIWFSRMRDFFRPLFILSICKHRYL